jgi:hypothetical protein
MRGGLLAFLLVLILTSFPVQKASVLTQESGNRAAWVGPYKLGAFVHRVADGRASCLEASLEQAQLLKDRNTNIPLTVLTPDSDPSRFRPGLRIILRGTSQLQSAPQAIEAFKRAAARWENVIRTVTTIVIDVDYGYTLFGGQFEDGVAAATDSQVLGGNSLYPAVRDYLMAGPYSPEERSFYASLPIEAVPTDTGESPGMVASSATLRALDLISPIAHPEKEFTDFGPPPAIAFNSKLKFDFDAGDGIDPDKLDFEAIALHEIGHVLGVISFVGQQEMNPALEVEPTIWDLFRVRPDSVSFTTAQRILSSGGEQSFYDGGASAALSTGRPDGTGGDGRQASHWRDDNLSGRYLGVMDPTIGLGEHQFLTDADLVILDAIGYRAKSLQDPTTVVPLISGVSQAGEMIAPPPGLGVLSHLHYSIVLPPGATQLKVDLTGNQDVDLFARFGRPVFNNSRSVVADYRSQTPTGSETITVSASSSSPLRQGIYYIGVANFGPGDAIFTLTATVTGGGYSSHAPAIFSTRARLAGDVLQLDYAATDRDGDLTLAEVAILDETELAVRPLSIFATDSGESPNIQMQLSIDGLSASPKARLARVVLVDRAGNRSVVATIDLGKGEAGGLTLTSASFAASKLTLKVRGLTENLELEINGLVVSPPRKMKVNGSGTKLTIKGNATQLALRLGANRIRVKNVSGWSNILVFGFTGPQQ